MESFRLGKRRGKVTLVDGWSILLGLVARVCCVVVNAVGEYKVEKYVGGSTGRRAR